MSKSLRVWAITEKGKEIIKDKLSEAIPKKAKVLLSVICEDPYTINFLFYGRRWDLIPMLEKSSEYFVVDLLKAFNLSRGVDYDFQFKQ